MESQNTNNETGPQRQVPSFFKDGDGSQGNGTPETSAAHAPGSSGNISPKPSTEGVWDRQPKNPYQLAQPSQEKASLEQFDVDPFAKSTGSSFWQQIKDRLFPEVEGVSPTRQKAMVILVPALAIVMIFVLRQVLSKAPQDTEGAMNDDAPVVTASHSDNEIDWEIPEPMPVVMRDPIKLGAQSTMDNGRIGMSDELGTGILSVRGILYSDDKPSAVIGNQIVHLNEKINDATIIKIDKDFVVFEKDGKTWIKKVAEIETEQEQEETEQEQEEAEQEQSMDDRGDLGEGL